MFDGSPYLPANPGEVDDRVHDALDDLINSTLGGGGGGGSSAESWGDPYFDSNLGEWVQRSSRGSIRRLGSGPQATQPATNVNPADRNGDGLDDTTNMALGVYRDTSSPSGYYYPSASGQLIPVLPNGAPYSGPDLYPDPAPAAPPRPGTWTGYGPQGQGTYYLDGPGGTAGTFIGRTTNPTTSTGGSGGGGGSSGGGGSYTPPRDYSGEQAAAFAAQAARDEAQNAFEAAQAEANRQFQWELAAAKTEADRAIAEMNYAVQLRRLGLDEKKFGVDAAETFGRLASSTDPLAFASFLHAGGGNIMNALSTGADALSSAALLPAARALQAMRGLGSGGSTGGGGFGTGSGGFPAYRSPTTGGGGTTPTPTDPGTAPPATPPVVAPPTVNSAGHSTNKDPEHGVISWGGNEGGGYIPPYQGYTGNTGQYEVIAGPTMPPPPPPKPPYTATVPGITGGAAPGGIVLGDAPANTATQWGSGAPYTATIPMYAQGTMRGLTRYATGTWEDPQIQQIAQFAAANPGSITQPSQETNPAVLAAISTQKAYLNSPQYQAAFGPNIGPISPLDYAKWKASYYDFLTSTGRPMAHRYAPEPPVQPAGYSAGDWAQIQSTPALKARYEANLAQQGAAVPAPQALANAAPQAAFQRPAAPVAAPSNLGFVNDPMMVTGDAPTENPSAGGARPEVIVNPTNAPIGVIPHEQSRQMMRGLGSQQESRTQRMMQGLSGGLSRFAEGTRNVTDWSTYQDPYNTASQPTAASSEAWADRTAIPYGNDVVAQPAPTTTPTTAPTTNTTTPTAPTSSISDPALTTGTTTGGTTGNTAGGTTGTGTIGANVPTGGGYGVNPLTDAQLGVTPGDIPTMQEVLGLRQGTQVPNLNYYDIAFNDLPPTLQQLYFNGLQGKYGIPTQDSVDQWGRYRMRGLGGGNLALGV